MSSWLSRLAYIMLATVITSLTLQILRNNGKVNRNMLASIGMGTSIYAIIKLIAYSAQQHISQTYFMMHIVALAAGVAIFGIWGIRRKSMDTKQN
jgi:hypothetical protein